MSEQLYRLCWRYEGETEIHRAPATGKAAAWFAADEGNRVWGNMIVHWAEPVPDYTPPAITAEMDLETRAGSPRGVESDLLGLP